MKSHYVCSTTPPDYWKNVCLDTNSFFHSSAWQTVLSAAFDTTTIYAWNTKTENGIALPTFKVGPFRVGYVGFPTGGSINGNNLTAGELAQLQHAKLPHTIHLVRLIVTPFATEPELDLPHQSVMETVVPDLPQWELANLSKSVRYDVRKAKRNEVQVIDAVTAHHEKLYHLYFQTIQRHKGALRYTKEYFRQIVNLSQQSPNLRCLVALYQEQVASFMVVGLDNNTAYYMHGANDVSLQQTRCADLLLSTAIQWAQSKGMANFNMMASPLDQPGLIRYKEKWGGESKLQKTYDLPLQSLPARLFSLANTIYRRWQTIRSGI